jgi:hypothetical protein
VHLALIQRIVLLLQNCQQKLIRCTVSSSIHREMLSQSRLLSDSLLLRAWAQPAVLASAFAQFSASASQQQPHAPSNSDGATEGPQQPGLSGLKERLAHGPGLDAFVGGAAEGSVGPYSVYAPNFKVTSRLLSNASTITLKPHLLCCKTRR